MVRTKVFFTYSDIKIIAKDINKVIMRSTRNTHLLHCFSTKLITLVTTKAAGSTEMYHNLRNFVTSLLVTKDETRALLNNNNHDSASSLSEIEKCSRDKEVQMNRAIIAMDVFLSSSVSPKKTLNVR